jgi:hypothetical protein
VTEGYITHSGWIEANERLVNLLKELWPAFSHHSSIRIWLDVLLAIWHPDSFTSTLQWRGLVHLIKLVVQVPWFPRKLTINNNKKKHISFHISYFPFLDDMFHNWQRQSCLALTGTLHENYQSMMLQKTVHWQ